MSDSELMQEFRHKVTPLRECAVRPAEPTWEENNGVVRFIQTRTQPLRLVLLKLAENSYVVMLCDEEWTPAPQGPCNSVQEFSNEMAANLAFEATAGLCIRAGWVVMEQYHVRVLVDRPNDFVKVQFDSEY